MEKKTFAEFPNHVFDYLHTCIRSQFLEAVFVRDLPVMQGPVEELRKHFLTGPLTQESRTFYELRILLQCLTSLTLQYS